MIGLSRCKLGHRFLRTERLVQANEVPAPPELPRNPVAALARDHGRLGIHVGPDTTTPRWNGEPLDLGWAMYVFRNR